MSTIITHAHTHMQIHTHFLIKNKFYNKFNKRIKSLFILSWLFLFLNVDHVIVLTNKYLFTEKIKDLFNLYVWAFCLYGGVCATWGLLAMWPEKTIRCPGTEVQVTMWMLWSWPGFSTERQVLLTGPIVSSFILLRMCYFRQFIITAEPRRCTHPLRAILSLSLVSLITRLVTELNHLCAIYVLCANASVLSGLWRVDTRPESFWKREPQLRRHS